MKNLYQFLIATLFSLSMGSIYAQPVIDLGPDTSFCEGNVLVLDATLLNADSLWWQDSSTAPTLNVDSSGTYWLLAYVDTNIVTDTINIVVDTVPTFDLGPAADLCPPDTLHQFGPVGMASYTWTFGGATITDTSKVVVTGQTGGLILSLVVVNNNGCLGGGVRFFICDIQGVEELQNGKEWLTIFPNPVQDKMTLRFKQNLSSGAEIQIHSLEGKLLRKETVNTPFKAGEEYSLEIGDLPAGNYFLGLIEKGQQHYQPFLKID